MSWSNIMVTWIKWSEGVAQGGRYIPNYQRNDDAMASFQLPVERFGDRMKNLKRERGLPFSTYAPRGGWVGSSLLYMSIAHYMQKGGGVGQDSMSKCVRTKWKAPKKERKEGKHGIPEDRKEGRKEGRKEFIQIGLICHSDQVCHAPASGRR